MAFHRDFSFLLAALLLAAMLAGCGKEGVEADPADASPAQAARYLAPPEPTEVRVSANGVTVIGRAEPETRIRAVTPAGKAYGATAGADGRFTLEIPHETGLSLVAFSAEAGGRSVLPEGWLFVPADAPAMAVLLRPGAPARPLGKTARPIAAVDYDPSGGAVVAGVVAPNAAVTVAFDATAPVQVQADAQGVFGARFGLRERLSPGAHRVRVTVGTQATERTVVLSGPTAEAFAATREADGWRVNWTAPGGGRQITFIPLAAGAAS